MASGAITGAIEGVVRFGKITWAEPFSKLCQTTWRVDDEGKDNKRKKSSRHSTYKTRDYKSRDLWPIGPSRRQRVYGRIAT